MTCSYVPDAGRECPIAGDLRSGLAFETLIAELSSRFIHLAAGEMDAAIESALRSVCEPLGIELAVLWQWSAAVPGVIAPTHAYLAHGGALPSEPMNQADYPWSVGEMLAGRTIRISSPERLPAAAAVDRETCRRYGIRAALCVPLAPGGEPAIGALGFNDLRAEREWPEPLVKRLELVAGVFANALTRRRHDAALRESEERLALAADSAEAGLWTLDYGSGSFWTTNRARAIFTFPQGEPITMEVLQARVDPEDWPRVRDAIDRSARESAPVEVEYRIVSPADAGPRWIHSRGRPASAPTCGPPVSPGCRST